jgi:hypothetical protein
MDLAVLGSCFGGWVDFFFDLEFLGPGYGIELDNGVSLGI